MKSLSITLLVALFILSLVWTFRQTSNGGAKLQDTAGAAPPKPALPPKKEASSTSISSLRTEISAFLEELKVKSESSGTALREVAEAQTPERIRARVLQAMDRNRNRYEQVFDRWNVDELVKPQLFDMIVTRNEAVQGALFDKLAGKITTEESERRKAEAEANIRSSISSIADQKLAEEVIQLETVLASEKRQRFMKRVSGVEDD